MHFASPDWIQHAATLVANPMVAPFLLCLGFLGLLAEIRTPNFGMAGAAGLLALGLFFGAHIIVGLAGVGDILLVGGGMVLFGLEIFIIPGFGVVGIVGVLGVLAGTYLSLLGPHPAPAELLQAALVLASAVALSAVAAWLLLRSVPAPARPGGHGIFLPHRTEGGTALASEGHGRTPVGAEGAAITDLTPSGTALFGEERIEVVSEAERIPAGTPVRVVATGGYRRVVSRVSAPGTTGGAGGTEGAEASGPEG